MRVKQTNVGSVSEILHSILVFQLFKDQPGSDKHPQSAAGVFLFFYLSDCK